MENIEFALKIYGIYRKIFMSRNNLFLGHIIGYNKIRLGLGLVLSYD